MQFADLDRTKAYTYADYFKWQIEERLELIKGTIFQMGAPNRVHQALLGFIHAELFNFLRNKDCNVYVAPFDVRFPWKTKEDKDIITVLQPDICVICDATKLDDRGCLGAPDLVVEILSPGNNARDMRLKYNIYEEAGVGEYWIVSPQNETFLIYRLVGGKYVAERTLVAGDMVQSTVLPGFELNLEWLFDSVR